MSQRPLTPQQERFLHELALTPEDQADAWRRACAALNRPVPKAAKQNASACLKLPQVAARWAAMRQARAAKLELSAEQLLQDLYEIYQVDMHQVAPWGPDGAQLIPSRELTRAQRRAVKKLKVWRTDRTITYKDGRVEHRVEVNHAIELYSLKEIAELLGKHLGLWAGDGEEKGTTYNLLVIQLREKLAGKSTDELRAMAEQFKRLKEAERA